MAGRTFLFDVRDPLHSKVATSFTDLGGHSHPHSFPGLPNGHVLASFQNVADAGTGAAGAECGGRMAGGNKLVGVTGFEPATYTSRT